MDMAAVEPVEVVSPVVLAHTATSKHARNVGIVCRYTARVLLKAVAWLLKAPLPNAVVALVVAVPEFLARVGRPSPKGARFAEVALPECSARWCLPEQAAERPERVILYLHGGGFISCGFHTHKGIACRLGGLAAAGVLFVEYKQMPFHTVDDSVRHCAHGYRWLLDQGWRPEQIVFAGDSAGGFFVYAAALRALEEGLPAPAGIVAMSPWTDWDLSGKLAAPTLEHDLLFPPDVLDIVDRSIGRAQHRLGKRGPVRPVPDLFSGPLGELPPSVIHVSDCELLLPDSQKLAAALGEAGAKATLKTWAGQTHVFQLVASRAPEAEESLAELAAFIRSVSS
ncbi:MAG: alpha/beta hydrolase [Segniliparus sp.]|uniref:alpha/beta hydrolase n=1 Tax=Segniliparus sp. TaxID=2804064 RepID=UPI003F32D236